VPGSNAAVRREPQGQAPGGLSAAAAAELEAKMQNVLRRWGDRLNEDQRTRMRGIITRHVRMLETVRAIPTDNADPPASVLKLVERRSIPSPAKPAAAPKKSPFPSPEDFS
jgi:hypothetical protein